uniref:Serine protease 23 n=1 Tax=Paramormyrops kingsleyae TaxID=1676925 RepID=A0A3B3RFG9_9TELE
FARYCDLTVREKLCCLKPMTDTTKGKDIAKVLVEHFEERGIDLGRIFAPLSRPLFTAEPQLDLTTVNVPVLSEWLAFETLYSDGSRTLTTVDLRMRSGLHPGQKRQIYGEDGRFSIRSDHFLLDYPFSTTVHISTGCTGVLGSARHVLTATNCVHEGKDYVKGARKLKVGFITPIVHWVLVMDFHYAPLELRWLHQRPFMRLSAAPSLEDLAGRLIHFSGFDSDRPGELVYRFCSVEDESSDLIYQNCEAQPGASSSGVCSHIWDSALERWERRVIGVFSGHQWLEVDGENCDFNVVVWFMLLKISQICYWLHRSHEECSQDLD